MQHETQNSKVAQHPVEFLQPLQLNSKLEVEFLSQQPFAKTLFLGQTYPETKREKIIIRQVTSFLDCILHFHEITKIMKKL